MGKFALTPQQVVNNRLTFAIPIYQRLFAWSEEQILPLLLDLLYRCVKTRNSHHYIGLLTTKNQDLVDGQQRFTVMTLIALVFRERMSDGESWNSFLLEGGSLRLAFTARKNDEEFLRRLVDMNNCVEYINSLYFSEGTTNELYYNEMMAKGILTIAHFLDNLQNHVTKTLELPSDKVPNIDELGKYIFEHLAFFIQEMPKGYSPMMMNKYFESMNSTGRNLENHEILKVDLLKAAFPGVSNGEEYNKYVSMWNKASQMDRTIFGSDEDNMYISFIKGDKDPELQPVEDESMSIEDALSAELSQLKISSSNQRETRFHSFLNFTDFLLQVLWLELQGKTLKENHKIIANRFFKREELRKTFMTYLEYIEPKDFILKVYKYRIILDWAIIRIDGEGDYELLAESNSEYSKLEQYEAMLFASSSQYTYYRWLPLVLKEVMERRDYNKDKLLEILKSIDNKVIHPKPEQDFNYKLGIDTYFFRRLDYYIWEKVVFSGKTIEELKNDLLSPNENFLPGVIESIKAYKFHQYNSIEHLYPQNEDQQLELNKWSRNDLDLDHFKILNEFGNLALISGIYNSTQNNQSLNHKFVNVAEHVIKKKIESIKLAIMYCCANGDLKNWTKPKAVEHQKKMMKILEDSYK
jgi:hypothetical protein